MLYLFNTNIVPTAAVVRVEEITKKQARALVEWFKTFTSAIGHQATADAFSTILETEVPVNRIMAIPQNGDVVISLKLNGRLEEGKILTSEEMEEMGYTLFQMSFYDEAHTIHAFNHNGDGY